MPASPGHIHKALRYLQPCDALTTSKVAKWPGAFQRATRSSSSTRVTRNVVEPLLVAIALAGCHLLAPHVHRVRRLAEAEAASFTGGLAVSYVFLHLLPEIQKTQEHVGDRVYFIVLVGFAVFYGIETALGRQAAAAGAEHDRVFALRLALAVVYNLVLAYTLVEHMPADSILTALFAMSMSLHLMSTDFGLLKRFGEQFVRRGRYVLVAAVASGLVASHLLEANPLAVGVVTASLAGFIIFRVFKEELAHTRDARFGWFLCRAICMGTLHVLVSS